VVRTYLAKADPGWKRPNKKREAGDSAVAAATIQIYFIRHLVLATWLDASPGRLTAELDLGRDDSSAHDTQDVVAHDLPYVGLRTAGIQEGLSNSDDLARASKPVVVEPSKSEPSPT